MKMPDNIRLNRPRLMAWLLHDAIHELAFVINRLFLIGVVFPASTVATLFLLYGVLGDTDPVQASIRGLYQYAEDAIRPAPVGHVIVRECVNEAPAQPLASTDRPRVICPAFREQVVTTDTAATQAAHVLVIVYVSLVVFSFLVSLFVSTFYQRNRRKAG